MGRKGKNIEINLKSSFPCPNCDFVGFNFYQMKFHMKHVHKIKTPIYIGVNKDEDMCVTCFKKGKCNHI